MTLVRALSTIFLLIGIGVLGLACLLAFAASTTATTQNESFGFMASLFSGAAVIGAFAASLPPLFFSAVLHALVCIHDQVKEGNAAIRLANHRATAPKES